MAESFKSNLKRIKDYLSDKGKLIELANRAGVTKRTVDYVFAVNTFEELTNKKLTVYQVAIAMVAEIEALPNKANEVLKTIADVPVAT